MLTYTPFVLGLIVVSFAIISDLLILYKVKVATPKIKIDPKIKKKRFLMQYEIQDGCHYKRQMIKELLNTHTCIQMQFENSLNYAKNRFHYALLLLDNLQIFARM